MEDRAYPLHNHFDDEDDDIDEGGEWRLGRRRPVRSRSVRGRTPTKRPPQRHKRRQKRGGEIVDGEDDVVARVRGRRLLDKIIGIISQLPAEDTYRC